MRILDTKSLSSVNSTRSARAGASSGARFTLENPAVATRLEAQAPVSILGGLEALIAIKSEDQQKERRRRSVRRGQGMLDVLDELKLGLLAGRVPLDIMQRLKAALYEDGPTGDPRLDTIIDGIELRAEVELAKLRQVQGAKSGQ